ncbi:MAG: hypothetical protein RR505_00860, partial [Raoultibacter sp.]
DYESVRRGFESLTAHHLNPENLGQIARGFSYVALSYQELRNLLSARFRADQDASRADVRGLDAPVQPAYLQRLECKRFAFEPFL